MSLKTEATVEDLAKIKGKAELVNGKVVKMAPASGVHNYAALRIAASLLTYEQSTTLGHAATDNAAFVVNLPKRRSLSPDAAYHNYDLTKKFFDGPPLFAAEVRSDSDYGRAAERRLAAKRADYFAAGTLVVWDVDLDGDDVIRSYGADSPTSPTIFRRGEIAHAEPAVPGWSMPVDDLLP